MSTQFTVEQALLAENAELRARLDEAEETLRAIRSGEIDALVIETSNGSQIYTLQGQDAELNRFRGEILAQISDAVIVVDDDQHVTYLNASAEQQYGITASEALGRLVTEIFQCRWLQSGDEDKMIAALSETGYWRGENVHVKRNGEVIHAESSVTRLHSVNGPHSGQLAVIRDITERKQAEQALKDADRRKDEFLAMLAHELRNPLGPMHNVAQLLKMEGIEAARISWCGNVIERQVGHLSQLVDDLLDISRITLGKIKLKKEPLLVADFILPAVETVRPLIDARQQEFSLTLSPQPLQVEGDQVRLTQVLANLLSNAVKYTENGGRIEVRVEQSENKVFIYVCDTGCGIELSALPHLFELFYQVDSDMARSQGGLGIGLSLVHRLVVMHGGDVQAFSAGLGQGSEFVVRLPLASLPENKAAVIAKAHPSSTNGELGILIVDDYCEAAESLAMVLEHKGYRVWIAHDGLSALEMAKVNRPQVVILDIGLPVMDGYEVAEKLHQSIELGEMLIIGLSGYELSNNPERLDAAGFDEYMVKPANVEKLQRLLEKWQMLKFSKRL
jgi:PAS domain S-box-containing protein